ncbi:hypothetical protein CDV55_104162 [Aspergillus turcosus]|nr:hypothetical protein CDV55_104162 [Aspergillus turcosus]
MNSHEQPPISEPLRSTAISIAQISPGADRILERSIHAIVTLVWPYSSSNKSLSLLLAEPDFRLRRNNGQVKVVFHGCAAEAVAKSQVGIGDHVYLGLTGSKFVASEAAVQTPGKCVPWEVHLDDRVLLEIWRSSQYFSTVKLDPSTVPTQITEDTIAPPATPIANGRVDRGEPTPAAGLEAWRSPAFVERTRTSFGGLVDSAYDPFAEEDGFVPGKGRKRPRFSFRGAAWRVVDEPASPGEREIFTATATVSNAPEGAEAVADVDHESLDVGLMSPEQLTEQPTRPNPQFAQPLRPSGFPQRFAEPKFAGSDFQHSTDTPRLYPIPSPGLPIPSTLVTKSSSAHDYFPPVTSNVQTPLHESAAEGEGVEMTEENVAISRVEPDVSTRQELEPLVTPSQQAIARNISVLASQDASIDLEVEGQRGMKDTSAADATPFEGKQPAHHDEDVEKPIPNVPAVSLEQPYAEKPAEVASRAIEEVVEEESEQSDLDQGSAEVQDEERNEASDDELEEQSEEESEEELEAEESAEEEEDELVEEYGYEDVHEQRNQRPPESFGAKNFYQDGTRHYEDSEVEEIAIGTNGALEDDKAFSAAERHAAEEKVHRHILEDESGEDERESDYEDEGTFDEEDLQRGDERVEVLDDEEEEEEEDEEEDEEEESEDDEEEEQSELEDGQEAYEDDYDRVESESESYAATDGPAQPEKVVHPEIIVLDSDSEDEPAVSALVQARTPLSENAAVGNDVESYATSAEEDEVYDRSSVGSEAEEWPEVEDELAEDYQTGDDEDEEAERESMQDEIASRDNAEDELMEDAPSEEDFVAEERIEIQSDTENDLALVNPVKGEVEQEVDIEKVLISGTHNEVLQATSDVPQSPEGQDMADFGVTVAQSTGPHTDSAYGPRPQDLAIDPELYRLEGTGEHEMHSPEADAHAEPVPDEPVSENEDIREPFFDGAASPGSLERFAERASHFQAPSPRAQQLVTPDASQLTAPNDRLSTAIPICDFPPTPEQTQEVAQGLTPQYDAHADTLEQTVLQISTTSIDTDVSSRNEYNVRMSSTLAEQQKRTQTDGASVHDEEYAMSSVGDEAPSEVPDWGVSAQPLKRMPSAVDRHHPGLRSKYSYFAPLATLIDHYNSLIDTISVVSDASPTSRATSGKKDYNLTLHVTDPSMAGTIIQAQIFRPYKSALPSVEEGDAILLRNFQVKSFNHSMMLVSVDTSAWAVFHNSSKEAQVAGPPVEYGDEENAYATDLRQWYHEVGVAMVADYQLQASAHRASREATPVSSVAHSDAGSVDSASREARGESSVSNRGSKRRKSHRRITIHELRDGRRYVEVGSPSDKESIHELRDGTLYANL